MTHEYRESFSTSFPIRAQQHEQMQRFLSRRLQDAAAGVDSFFLPDFSSVPAYERSIADYRDEFLEHLGLVAGAEADAVENAPARSGISLRKPSVVDDGRQRKMRATARKRPEALRGTPGPMRIEPLGHDDLAEYSRIWIPVASDLDLYGLYITPRKTGAQSSTEPFESPGVPGADLPLIVAQHGGGGCPEAICGVDEREAYDGFGRRAVERGYAVFAPFILMTVTYGGDPPPKFDRYAFDQMARLANLTIVGVEVFKIAEGVRRLISTVEEIDASRVAIAGLSYGGFFSLYAAAASRLFACAVVSAILSSRVDDAAHGSYARGLDRLMPGAACTFETHVIGGLVCPRPLMIQHGVDDPVVPVDAARAAAGRIARWYDRLGIADRYSYSEHAGGHRFDSDSVLDFIDRNMRRCPDDTAG